MATSCAPPLSGGCAAAAGSAARPQRRCRPGRRPRRAAAAPLAVTLCVFACLAAACCGTPAPSAIDGGVDGVTALSAPPSRLSRLPTLASIASRASEVGGGPCSSDACIRRWKGGFIAALFVEGVVGGVAPRALRLLSPAGRSRSLHLANAFSGGIFFTTGMLHILPEAVAHLAGEGHGLGEEEEHDEEHEGEEEGEHDEEHDEEHSDEGGHGFPTGYALAVAGYYAIFFLERLVLGRFTHSHHAAARASEDAKGQSFPLTGADDPVSVDSAAPTGVAVLPVAAKTADVEATAVVGDATETDSGSHGGGGGLMRTSSGRSAASVGLAATDASGASSSMDHVLEAQNVGFFSRNFGRASISAFSVAIHVVFESLSLGLASSWSAVFNTFLAIAAHKWATAASLGVKFEKERLRWLQSAVLIVIWSAVSPAAAGIGAAIDSGVSDEVTGVLLALSAGTFLYIGAFEVAAEEFVEHTGDQWAKAAAMTVGMAVIMIVTGILSRTGVH